MKTLHVRLVSRAEQLIPTFGPVWYRFQVPSRFDGYLVQRARVHLFAEHDCPSDLSIYLEAPRQRRVELYYRDDGPDWSIELVRDCSAALCGLPVSGAWLIVFDDLIFDDGGLVREVDLHILAARRSLLPGRETFDHYDPDLADAVLTRSKHRHPLPPPL